MFDSFPSWASDAAHEASPGPTSRSLSHTDDVNLLRAIAAGRVTTQPKTRMDLRRLAREELILAGFGAVTTPTLLPRGQRILDAANGLLPRPVE